MFKKNKGEHYAAAWKFLTSSERLRPSRVKGRSQLDARTEFENDFDRVVFSSSFRRLRNKAQVFSLEPHDFVRTRLTHSIEVATIGRSLGEGAAAGMMSKYPELSILSPRDIGTIVATACLLHDIGNPPFGHSGEKAIGRWFSNNIDTGIRLKLPDATERADLTDFEGNAQSFRIATRLQWSGQDFGMNLTAATLSTLIKYPCASNEVQPKGKKTLRKFGYFKADTLAFDLVRSLTKLDEHRRHPLTYLMEAADDIGYATGDIEDVLKKGFVDFGNIHECLSAAQSKESKECVEKFLDEPYKQDFKKLELRERQQLSVQRFCQMAIRLMMKSAIAEFLDSFERIMDGTFEDDLVGKMSMRDLCYALKSIMTKYVYSHIEIAHREQTARNVIAGLLAAIVEELQDRPTGALALSAYRVPPTHEREDEMRVTANYALSQRAADYVAGMTDGHALVQYQRISGMRSSY
jgi:dGTPase